MARDFLLTTANSLEGYVIVKQCGIVFGETVFKHSLSDSFSAGLSNMRDSFRLRATEMSGTMELIEKAREYAYNKLISQAESKGANAVIAIDSDNTIGNDVMYISLYGTAVKVVTIAEYDSSEKERKATEEKLAAEEKIRKEELKKKRLEGRNNLVAAGGMAPEDKFLIEISGLSSMIDIWKKWNEYNLKELYPEVDEYIGNKKEVERMYGRKDVSPMKMEIEKMLQN